MNRALLLITAPAAAAIALWGGAVLGYKIGITLAALLVAAAAVTFLASRRPSTSAHPSTSAQGPRACRGEGGESAAGGSNRKPAPAGKGGAAGG